MSKPVVIVTGASGGMGAAIAHIAVRLGAQVVITARRAEALAAVVRSLQEAGGAALPVPGDISRPDDCQRTVAEALRAFGRLDAIINNAGILEPIAPIAGSPPEAWEQNIAINLLGPVWLTQAALPHLRPANGRVINISSGAATYPYRGWSAYTTAKAGLNHFTRVLALEEPAITAIALRPGAVDTPMQALIRDRGAQAGMAEADYRKFADLSAEGRLLPPELPGKSAAVLALYAPHELSGEFINWDDARVLALVARYTIPPARRD